MSSDHRSPIDLPAPPLDRPGLGWTAAVIAIAAATLLATNAVSLRDWAAELPPGPVQARLETTADRWLALTDMVLVGRPRALLHDLWTAAEAARFAGSDTDKRQGEIR